MVFLSEKGAHGVSARCEKVCMLLPQRREGGTLKNHMLFIANSTTVASQTTLLALSSWPAPANRPVAIGKPWQRSLNCKNRGMRLPKTGS